MRIVTFVKASRDILAFSQVNDAHKLSPGTWTENSW